MSSGVTHATISVAAAPLAFVLALEVTGSPSLALCAAAGCGLLGILLTPDLDQETTGWAENKLLRNRNLLVAMIGAAHALIWYPYAKLIPHRHFLSHFPVVGTALRLGYLFAACAVLYWFAVEVFGWTIPLPELSLAIYYGTPTVCGLALSDALHWITDIISSAYKRRRNKIKTRGRRRRI